MVPECVERLEVSVNGRPELVAAGTTIAALVSTLTGQATGGRAVAVAVNSEVVPRSQWASTRLAQRDRVEVLSPAQGG